MKYILTICLFLSLIVTPIYSHEVSKTEHATYAVIYTGLAVWGWTSTNKHNSGYIRVAASWCSIKALAHYIVAIADNSKEKEKK